MIFKNLEMVKEYPDWFLNKTLSLRIYRTHDKPKKGEKICYRWHFGYMECKECKKLVMEPLFCRLVRECPYFLYWNPLGTCGAKCELALAKKLHKRIIMISKE